MMVFSPFGGFFLWDICVVVLFLSIVICTFGIVIKSSDMSIQQMQQQLINQISAVNDEDILRMLSEELSYSLEGHADLASLLSNADFKELTLLADEPVDQNTISFNEFNAIMEQWRMK